MFDKVNEDLLILYITSGLAYIALPNIGTDTYNKNLKTSNEPFLAKKLNRTIFFTFSSARGSQNYDLSGSSFGRS